MSDITIKELVGFNSFMTNCDFLNGKFKNSSRLHITFKISDNLNNENIFKFRTGSSLTAATDKVVD